MSEFTTSGSANPNSSIEFLIFSYSLSPGFSFLRGLYSAGFRSFTGSTFSSAVFILLHLSALCTLIKSPPASVRAETPGPACLVSYDWVSAFRTESFRAGLDEFRNVGSFKILHNSSCPRNSGLSTKVSFRGHEKSSVDFVINTALKLRTVPEFMRVLKYLVIFCGGVHPRPMKFAEMHARGGGGNFAQTCRDFTRPVVYYTQCLLPPEPTSQLFRQSIHQ